MCFISKILFFSFSYKCLVEKSYWKVKMISSLLIKPQIFTRKIKTKNIGYVCLDGTINFQNVKSAHKYAKSVVVRALNQEEPFERVVMIEGSRVMKQVDGDNKGVYIPMDPLTILCDTIVHGHPDLLGKGITASFSDKDVQALFFLPYDTIRTLKVYNSIGEVSIMRRLGVPLYRVMGFTDECLNVLRSKYAKSNKIIGKLSNEICDIGSNIYKKLETDDKFFRKFVKDLSKDQLLEDTATKTCIYANHIALKKFASKLKVSYKTNFTNLNKKHMSIFNDFMS